jgi:hypothetical protein
MAAITGGGLVADIDDQGNFLLSHRPQGFLSGVAFGLEAIDATHTDAGSHHGGRAELRPGVHVCPQPFMI